MQKFTKHFCYKKIFDMRGFHRTAKIFNPTADLPLYISLSNCGMYMLVLCVCAARICVFSIYSSEAMEEFRDMDFGDRS